MKTTNYKILKTLTLSIFMGFGVLSTQAQIYVNASASGANNGTSWSNAYTNLQPALDAAPPCRGRNTGSSGNLQTHRST
jgi:hypothetical protein